MASLHYIATRLREYDPVACLGLSDTEVIAVANRCTCCGEPIHDGETLADFAAVSETAEEFYDRIIFRLHPQTHRTKNDYPGYEGPENDN